MSNEVVSNMKTETEISVPPESVHYRILADDELRLLHPIFERLGWAPPDPSMCKAVVAEAGEGERAMVLGFSIIQFVTHAEPLWIDPNCRGMGVAEGLVEATVHYIEQDCKIKRYVCVAKPGSFAARLAEHYGMVAYPGQLYVKQLA